jgi:hypothetical protein
MLAKTNNTGLGNLLLSSLVSKKTLSPGLELMIFFLGGGGCGLCSCNILAETNNASLLLSCLVSELQKPSSSGIESTTDFRSCDLCYCNFLAEINNLVLAPFFFLVLGVVAFVAVISASKQITFRLGAVFRLCLVSELQELPSPGLELRTVLRSLDLSEMSFWFQGVSMRSLAQNAFSSYKRTYLHTYPQFQFYIYQLTKHRK